MSNEIRMKNEETSVFPQTTASVMSMLRIIRSMEGEKTITIHRTGPDGIREYKIDKTGKFALNDTDEFMFRVKLHTALAAGGAMIVRRITDVMINGLPVKTVCGASLGKGTWIASASKETEEIFCSDPNTGRRIPREPNVVYTDFPACEIEER